ncbi:MAG: hypothetical protein AB1629_00845 [Candidatus Omnitrophota bacterium]
MIKAKDFNIFQIQASIFTPALQFSQTKILSGLISKFSTVFDGTPISLPLPQDAPSEIPRLSLRDSGENIKLEIALNRANFFIYQKQETVIDEDKFFNLCLPVFEEYIKLSYAKVGRLAIVVVNILKQDTPGLTLVQHFCKDRWLKDTILPENFEIHSHKKYEFGGFNVNNWIRCKSGILVKESAKVVMVEEDINTLAEDLQEKDFDMPKITSFLRGSFKKQKELLEVYFPNNEE